MRQRSRTFLRRVGASRVSFMVSILIAVACWLLSCVVSPADNALNNVLSFLLYGAAGYLLIALNNTFAIIRLRGSIQTSVFFILMAVCVPLNHMSPGIATLFSFLAATAVLFLSFQRTESAGYLFYSFLVIGLCSLYVPKFTWLVPLFWIGSYLFQSLNLKSFLASLLGWMLPFWFLSAYAGYKGDISLLLQPLDEIITFHHIDYSHLSGCWPMLAYLLFVYMVIAVHCLYTAMEEKIQTRSYLHFFIVAVLFVAAIIFLQPQMVEEMLPLLIMCVSVLAGRFISIASSRASNVFFIVALLLLLPLFAFSLWTRL